MLEGGILVAAEERPFKEVEGEDEEKGGGDPIAAHQHKEPLLVDAEGAGLLPELAKGAEGALVLLLLLVQALCS